MELIKIGSIEDENGNRLDIMYDGESLCDAEGTHIDDGKADTVEKAYDIAAQLWRSPVWNYQVNEYEH